MKLHLAKIAEFIQAATQSLDLTAMAEGYSIDTRTLQPGELFFAIVGERLDGHDFVDAALQAGAVAAVVDQAHAARFAESLPLLVVHNTTEALQQLGAAARRLWGRKLIAVTGSAGKTTTKEAIAHLLAAHYEVLKSQGNLNNHYGLPLQLLRIEPQQELAVIEMGMSHPGEIRQLAALAAPDEGVVTNVGLAHLENLGSQEGIARAKYELIEALPTGGHAFLNADDNFVAQFGRDFHGKVTFYGLEHAADYRAEKIVSRGVLGTEFELVGAGFRQPARLALMGRHNVRNAVAAVAVAVEHGITPQEAAARLATMTAGDKRGQLIAMRGATLINDCYNSNPNALLSMVSALSETPARRRVVIAGEMLELGSEACELHRNCGREMARLKVDYVIGVRGHGRSIAEGATEAGIGAQFVETPEEAGQWLAGNLQAGDVVLLKASRGVGLERALLVVNAKNEN